MPRGGFRPGSGPKKGTKYRPRVSSGIAKRQGKEIKKKIITKLIVLLERHIKGIEKNIDREKQARRVFVCQQCGGEFISGIKQGPKKYCSVGCRKAARSLYDKNNRKWKENICTECGSPFQTQNDSRYCSGKCWGKAWSRDQRKNRPVYHCRKCGKEFYRCSRPTDSLVYCSRKCAGCGEIGKARYPRDPKKGNYYKRSKINGVAFEIINISDVFERDGWHCQICGKDTPKKNRGTIYPNAPEIDHRIPMSRGGGHLYNNVQCACRKCNHDKSNKTEAGQMPLFEIRSVA